MKRRLFFLLEKLEIKRSERFAISALLILFVILSTLLTFYELGANYSEEEYAKLEKTFREKSAQVENKKKVILARYEPNTEMPVSRTIRKEEKQQNVVTLPDTTVENEPVQETSDSININTATAEQLQKLPGVGPTYAGRIVNWREKNGSFTSKDQLLEIKGIGDKRIARIKPLIVL